MPTTITKPTATIHARVSPPRASAALTRTLCMCLSPWVVNADQAEEGVGIAKGPSAQLMSVQTRSKNAPQTSHGRILFINEFQIAKVLYQVLRRIIYFSNFTKAFT